MPRLLKILLIALMTLVVLSFVALFAYDRYAERAMGPASTALAPPAEPSTQIDHALGPLTQRHPGRSGLALVSGNAEAFSVRALSARHAGRSLDIQYYLWHDDLTGRLLTHEVLAAADRGVRVRILLDDINAHGADAAIAGLASHPNIDVRMFNPSRNRGGSVGRAAELLLRGLSLNRRMHNKAWIVDGQLAVVGGRNVGNEYFDAAQDTNFLDADLAMLGPVVEQTAVIFDEYWNSRAALPIESLSDETPLPLDTIRASLTQLTHSSDARPYLDHVAKSQLVQSYLDGSASFRWTEQARVVSDPVEKAWGDGEDHWLIHDILDMARSAERELALVSPYFVPGDEGVDLLLEQAAQGTEVTILTNSLASNDVVAVHSGYAPYRKPLLEGGIAIYELMPEGGTQQQSSLFGSSGASLHTKAFMVDGSRGYVGSFNFDPRSVHLNTEMGVMFEDEVLVRALLDDFDRHTDTQHSFALSLQDGDLRWHDRRSDPPRLWDQEPEASAWRRAAAWLLSWLPLEQHL